MANTHHNKAKKPLIDNPEVAAFLQTQSGRVLFTPSGAYFDLAPAKSSDQKDGSTKKVVLKAGFSETHAKSRGITPQVRDQAAAKLNFLRGPRDQWQKAVPTYRKLAYDQVWNGISLEVLGHANRLEYQWLLEPGCNPEDLRMESGAETLRSDEAGALIAELEGVALTFSKPRAFQMVDGVRHEVEVAYKPLEQGAIAFTLGAYDVHKRLVISPDLIWATFMGGYSKDDGEQAAGVAVDAADNIYLAGTAGDGFPTTVGAYAAHSGKGDVFVAKFDPTCAQLLYATFIGGSQVETLGGIQVDANGSAVVVGSTASSDFPITPGAYKPNFASSTTEAFVTKLNSQGSDLVFSTFLGVGSARDLALDAQENIVVAGYATHASFPTTNNAYNVTFTGPSEAFVASLNPSGTALNYATFMGTTTVGSNVQVELDTQGNVYVAGNTGSTVLPITPGAVQASYKGQVDTFVIKLNATGSSLLYCTYVGGLYQDYAHGLAVDGNGSAYVTGFTTSDDFPVTSGSYAEVRTSSMAVFVYKLNADATALGYATYICGDFEDWGRAIAVDDSGSAYVVGNTLSSHDWFPTTPGAHQETGDHHNGFALKLNPAGSGLVYSTLLGGNSGGTEEAVACAFDAQNNLIIVGKTTAYDFPVSETAYQTQLNGQDDIFVLSLNPSGSALNAATLIGAHYGFGVSQYGHMQVDPQGQPYVVTIVNDIGFPTTPGAYQDHAVETDFLIAKFNADATDLIYATYLGGTLNEMEGELALDPSGNVYIAGKTSSNDFPTTAGALRSSRSGYDDVIVSKLNSDGSELLFSTYLGGSGQDNVARIAADAMGTCTVLGNTSSTDFPVTSGIYSETQASGNLYLVKFDTVNEDLLYATFVGVMVAGGLALDETGAAYVLARAAAGAPATSGAWDETYNGSADLFVFKLNPTGTALAFGTYLGGTDYDDAVDLRRDGSGALYVLGDTSSFDFPTTMGAFDTTKNLGADLTISKLSADGSNLIYSTYVGGSAQDLPERLAVDANGAAYFCAYTQSTNFPTTANVVNNTYSGNGDLVAGRLSPDGSQLTYGTYLGGSNLEWARDIGLDAENMVYIMGISFSQETPTTAGVWQDFLGANQDAWIAKIDFCQRVVPAAITGETTVCLQESGVTYSIDAVANATGYEWAVPDGATITAGQGTTQITVSFGESGGEVAVRSVNDCGASAFQHLTVAILTSPEQPGAISGEALVCEGQTGLTFSVDVVAGASSYLWTVPADAMITSGQGSTEIQVDFGATAGEVSVLAQNACGDSAARTLEVAFIEPIQIQSSFQDTTICPGETLQVTVSASGDQPEYQWYLDGQPLSDDDAIAGSTSETLTIQPLDLSHQGDYTCEVANPCGSETSQSFTLTVAGPLAVTVTPPAAVQGLEPLTFTPTASCATGQVAYQWTNLESGEVFQTAELTLSVDRNTLLELEASDDSGDQVVRQVLILYPPAGNLDLNGDGVNNQEDLFLILPNWNSEHPLDLDGDGMLTILDFLYINTSP